jgi:hypothetical protein
VISQKKYQPNSAVPLNKEQDMPTLLKAVDLLKINKEIRIVNIGGLR